MQAAEAPKTWMQEMVAAQLVGAIPLLWACGGRVWTWPQRTWGHSPQWERGRGSERPQRLPWLTCPNTWPCFALSCRMKSWRQGGTESVLGCGELLSQVVAPKALGSF